MAMQTRCVIYGVDVSQEWLDVCRHGQSQTRRLANDRSSIDHWLKSLRGAPTALGVEATNTYHELLVERARHYGLTVYLISGYQLKHYANSLNVRMRTDVGDARLLARFLDREIDGLRPYEPRSPEHHQLMRLLKRRALLVKHRQQIQQSFASLPEWQGAVDELYRQHQRIIALIDRQMRKLARQLGWSEAIARLRSLPGIGPLNALALCAAYHAGDFRHRDPFVAYIGLDVRTKDSGKHKGKRKLTKKGCPEYRRLLHNAAMAASRAGAYFYREYQALQQRGFSRTAALVVISRKLARMAFGLLRNGQTFDPDRAAGACRAT